MEVDQLLKQLNIHIIALQETLWNSPSSVKSVVGFSWFASPPTAHGGIAFLVHDSLASYCSFHSPFSHHRIGVLTFLCLETTFKIINIYNHTSGDFDHQCSVLADLATVISMISCPFVVLGDFNSRVGNFFGGGAPELNRSGSFLVDFCQSWNLSLINVKTGLSSPTFSNGRSSSIIDFIAVPLGILSFDTSTHLFASSDHNLVFSTVSLAAYLQSSETPAQFHLDENPVSIEKFTQLSEYFSSLLGPVMHLARSLLIPSDCIEFCSILCNLIVHQSSLQVWKFHSQKKSSRPWWNPQLSSQFLHVKSLHASYTAQLHPDLKLIDYSTFSAARKQFRYAVRKAKLDYASRFYSSVENKSFKNLSSFWKFVRLRRRAGSSVPSVMMNSDSTPFNSPLDSLMGWSSHFGKIFSEDFHNPSYNSSLTADINDEVRALLLSSPANPSWLDSPFSMHELETALKTLHSTPAGFDGINYLPLVSSSFHFKILFLNLINDCLSNSTIPASWKIDIIFPLLKKGDPLLFNNYRGISLQPLFYKTLDIIISQRLQKFMNENNILDPNQAGYRPGYMCLDWIFIITELISHHNSICLPLFICFFDVRKAFDKVWHNGLFKLLFDIGITGRLLKLIVASYTHAHSMVLVNGLLSDCFSTTCGVKQGGCSSPILYLIFINKLASSMRNLKLGYTLGLIWLGLLLFADDTAIISSDPSEFQSMINYVADHCRRWRYSLAPEKTVVLTAGCKFKSHKFFLSGNLLEEVKCTRYLGGHIHRSGSHVDHFKSLSSSLSSALRSLTTLGLRNSSYSVSTLQKLFSSVALPSSTFGTEVFEACKTTCSSFDVKFRKFYKHSLLAAKSLPNAVLYGELLLMPYELEMHKSALRFFWRLNNLKSPNPAGAVFRKISLKVDLCTTKKSYLRRIITLAQKYHINLPLVSTLDNREWSNYISTSLRLFHDSTWRTTISTSSSLNRCFTRLKSNPHRDSFLKSIDGYTARLVIKLRAECSALFGSQLRYHGIPFDDRTCPLCHLAPESSVHFCGDCSSLSEIRSEFLSNLNTLLSPFPPPLLDSFDLTAILLQAPLKAKPFQQDTYAYALSRHSHTIQTLSAKYLKKLYKHRNFLLHSNN